MFKKKGSGDVAKDRLKLLLVSDRANCSPEVMEMIKNDIIKVISKYMVIDAEGLDIQITSTESDSNNGSVPALFANIPIKDMKKDIEAIRASASLPLVSRNVEIGGKLYLDGGISDSIPIKRSMQDGNRKNVVVMTKEIGYRRKPSSMLTLTKLRYQKYPRVYELMKNRHNTYNETLDFIEEQVKAGNVFLIRPKTKSDVGRIEKNKEKLTALYEQGYRDASDCYEELIHYLED